MAIFPNIELEGLVQEQDRTRIDATKTFVDTGDAVTEVRIKPNKVASEITVYSSLTPKSNDNLKWFLDQEYLFAIEMDSTNNSVSVDQGSGEEVATLATVLPAISSLSTVASDLETALNGLGGLTYSVSVNSDDQFVVSANGSFRLLGSSGSDTKLLGQIGFGSDTQSLTSHTGDKVETVDYEVTVSVDTATDTNSKTAKITIISELADKLFSSDSELQQHEGDILRFVRDGRNTWKDKHRASQDRILGWLDEHRYTTTDGSRLTKDEILDLKEVNDWSKFLTLEFIFEDISNAIDDIYAEKSKRYQILMAKSRNRAVLRFDFDKDGEVEDNETADNFTTDLIRR